MPAKIELNEENYKEVETLAAYLTQEQIADFLGMSRRSFANKLKSDKTLFAHYKKGKAKAIAKASGKLMKMVHDGNLTAIIFFLKTQAGWREGIDVTSNNNTVGAPKQINVIGRKTATKESGTEDEEKPGSE